MALKLSDIAPHLDDAQRAAVARQLVRQRADRAGVVTRSDPCIVDKVRDPAVVRIVLPLPPRELHAHAKGNWYGKAAPTKHCRERACAAAIAAGALMLDRGELSVDFYWQNLRRRDTANALHSIKPYIDGLIDAHVLPDDNWQVMSIGHIHSHLDRANPRVELTVREVTT